MRNIKRSSIKDTHLYFRYCILIFFLILPCRAHWNAAYFRNPSDGFTFKEDWMKEIPDNVKLTELALPATHNSATFTIHSDIYTTQCLTFEEQLSYGIRVFDISFNVNSFDDFLSTVNGFLEKHVSETVLIKLSANNDNIDNRNDLETILGRYSKYLKIDLETTLRMARNRFGIISDKRFFDEFGVRYKYTGFSVFDYDYFKTNWDLYSKWESVKAQLASAKSGDKNIFYGNDLTGHGGSFPYFVVSGHSSSFTSAPRLLTGLTTPGWKNSYPDFPRLGCFIGICSIAFEGTNVLTDQKISHYNEMMHEVDYDEKKMFRIGIKRTLGIIFTDFPGDLLISNIIQNNKFLSHKSNRS